MCSAPSHSSPRCAGAKLSCRASTAWFDPLVAINTTAGPQMQPPMSTATCWTGADGRCPAAVNIQVSDTKLIMRSREKGREQQQLLSGAVRLRTPMLGIRPALSVRGLRGTASHDDGAHI